eukprot:761711-Hanusia_phi.AAC.5
MVTPRYDTERVGSRSLPWPPRRGGSPERSSLPVSMFRPPHITCSSRGSVTSERWMSVLGAPAALRHASADGCCRKMVGYAGFVPGYDLRKRRVF